mgnify:CR=1 FL=1
MISAETPGSDADLNAYDVVYYAGDSNAGSKTIAINLPNDEEVQLEKGTRRLQLKNAMLAKYNQILVPIADELIAEDQRRHITFDSFFGNTMFHEVAHGLGIKNTLDGSGTVRQALQEHASALEEGKADVLGLYMVQKLRENGEITDGEIMDDYVTFLAGIFRSIRFGATSAHGRANMIRFNFFEAAGAFSRDEATGTYRVNRPQFEQAVRDLSNRILTLQGNGDYAAVDGFVAEMGNVGPALQADLDRLASAAIPVLFPAVKLRNEYFGDGSMRESAPLSPALHMGANRLLIIGVRNPRPDSPPADTSTAENPHFVPDAFGKVPEPGVHPRILISPEDLPAIRERFRTDPELKRRLEKSRILVEDYILKPTSRDGKYFAKLAAGDTADLELPEGGRQLFLCQLKGQQTGLERAGRQYWPHHLEQAIRAHVLYEPEVAYVVKEGEVIIVDEFTGRLMPGRRWSDGLHQAVEAKEKVKIERENQTLATVTFQNYFRMYTKLAGMTGTAETEAAEFEKIYKLEVLVIPTNEELQIARQTRDCIEAR